MSARINLHVHTCHSPDARLTLDELAQAARAAGHKLVCITDHDTISGCLEFARAYPQIPLLAGIEITCIEGDFLLYSVKVKALMPLMEKRLSTIHDWPRSKDVVVVWAHPLTRRFDEENVPYARGPELARVMAVLDGVETVNGKVLNTMALGNEPKTYLKRIRDLALAFGKAEVGGSDCHAAFSFFNAWTEIPDDLADPQGVMRAIKERLTRPGYDHAYFAEVAKVR